MERHYTVNVSITEVTKTEDRTGYEGGRSVQIKGERTTDTTLSTVVRAESHEQAIDKAVKMLIAAKEDLAIDVPTTQGIQHGNGNVQTNAFTYQRPVRDNPQA